MSKLSPHDTNTAQTHEAVIKNTPKKSWVLGVKALIATSFFIGLIYWVQVSFGWSAVLHDWDDLPFWLIISLTLFVASSHLLRIWRIHYAYNLYQAVTFIQVSAVSLSHNTISFLLPMRMGEAALPLLSRQQLQIDLTYSTSTLFLVRLFDLHVLCMFLLCFTGSLWIGQYAVWLAMTAIVSLPLLIYILTIFTKNIPSLAYVQPRLLNSRAWIKLYLITLMVWGIKLSALSFLAYSLGDLALNHAWVATIFADGSALSPITGFANAGTFEIAFSLPLMPLGYDANDLLRVAINVHLFIFITNIISGIVGFSLLKSRHPPEKPSSRNNVKL